MLSVFYKTFIWTEYRLPDTSPFFNAFHRAPMFNVPHIPSWSSISLSSICISVKISIEDPWFRCDSGVHQIVSVCTLPNIEHSFSRLVGHVKHWLDWLYTVLIKSIVIIGFLVGIIFYYFFRNSLFTCKVHKLIYRDLFLKTDFCKENQYKYAPTFEGFGFCYNWLEGKTVATVYEIIM